MPSGFGRHENRVDTPDATAVVPLLGYRYRGEVLARRYKISAFQSISYRVANNGF